MSTSLSSWQTPISKNWRNWNAIKQGEISDDWSLIGMVKVADRFDITREQNKHLAFGGGPLLRLGAHLARLEATLGLSALFTRYPDPALAVEPTALVPVPSLFSNSAQALPVHLTPAA
ncbi:hypothetical protein [Carbonactinospora thermoautotrophica]|uniref:hypothetical protein n=1 Tax=Carbonactinospora thermoautotrophica TaxID=1469144 RepID=UPI0023EEC720|nr:hypothetical protein [Carbonactinospora thermoautotrophica]